MKLGNASGGKECNKLLPLIMKHLLHTEVGEQMETQLAKIAQVAKENLNERFTSLMHLINESSLTQCHY